jgi:hypothetical protein
MIVVVHPEESVMAIAQYLARIFKVSNFQIQLTLNSLLISFQKKLKDYKIVEGTKLIVKILP